MTQVKNGNAFEYACVVALDKVISNYQSVTVVRDQRMVDCQDSFNTFSVENRNIMIKAAKSGISTILDYEPYLLESNPNGVEIQLNPMRTGKKGDVRDILIAHRETNWEIGISAKHNHHAVKHQRLSPNIDFGQLWFNIDTPGVYFDSLNETWLYLREQKEYGTLWSDIDKTKIYRTVLESFCNALETMNRSNYFLAARFLEYLLGRHDFYKVIVLTKEQQTIVRPFNIHNTLHKKSINGINSRSKSTMKLPKQILRIEMVDDANVIVYFDKGWTVKMRIHNASSVVEPSLKFDVQLEGVPDTMNNAISTW
jgi:hypothetical protein